MDHTSFDRIARLLAAPGSRRAALGALLGAGFAGSAEGLAKKPKKRRGGKKGLGRVSALQVPANCFTNPTCTPGPGKNLSKCDYGDSATLAGKNLKGANLGSANLFQADATGADLRGANLGKACLTNADLSGATINSSTNISTAIFCGTIMPDGSVNDRDCDRPTRCCETCTPIDDECTDETAPCCDGGACVEGTCQAAGRCLKDADCAQDEVCCTGECLAGICCTNAACGPTGNQCVSAGGAPTQCLCGLAPPCDSQSLLPDCCPVDPGPFGDRGGCTNLRTDQDNCGTCNTICPSGPGQAGCQAGACACAAGWVRLANGSCGFVCVGVAECAAGGCVTCSTDAIAGVRVCVTGAITGSCDNNTAQCPFGSQCSGGICTPVCGPAPG